MDRKIFGCLLAIVMIAFAMQWNTGTAAAKSVDSAVWDGSVDVSWYTGQPLDTTDYYISSPAQLAGLAYIVNGRLDTEQFPVIYRSGAQKDANIDVSKTVEAVADGAEGGQETVSGLTAESFWNRASTHIETEGGGSGVTSYDLYVGNQKYDFAGKTVHLTGDIDLGGTYSNDKASGPNWTPIGGRFPMDIKTLKIVVDGSFNGVFDGGGHTISNMYCNRQSGGNYMWSQGVGFIGCLGDLYDDASYQYGHSAQPESSVKEELLKGWSAGVRNLCVGNSGDDASFHGYIHANRMVGGIVGRAADAFIENCANFTSLSTTDHKGTAGIIGATDGTGVIRNCYNAGYIYSSSDGCPCAGISGSNTYDIYNCYNIGQINVPNAKTLSEGIGSYFGGTHIVDNCYSLNGSFTDTREDTSKNGYHFGTAADLIVNTEVVSGETMRSREFLSVLNANAGDVFVSGGSGINNGYPIFFWQASGLDGEKTATISAGGGDSKGSILIHVPCGGYMEKVTLSAGESAAVPVGSIVSLVSEAQAPNVLDHFTAGAKSLRANFYSVTSTASVTLDGSFLTLKSGKITFSENTGEYSLGISKNGTVLDNSGKAWAVRDQIVRPGDTVFQNDVLTAKAVLNEGAVSKDGSTEYTGKFTYTFSEGDGDTNTTGVHVITKELGSSMQVSVAPRTGEKNWNTYADTSWCADPDDVRGTYTISTARQLAGLAKLVNEGESFANATVKLSKNISLKNPDEDGSYRNWLPIGQSSGKSFQGTFDGRGHTVSGIYVDSDSSAGGLFGYCSNASIKNLTVSGRVCSRGNAAGIVSSMTGGSVSDCVNRVRITSQADRAGGIAAQISKSAKITSCINRGSVSGTSKAGGIVGETVHTAGSVSQCANYGDVNGSASSGIGTCSGGIAGYLGSTLDKCANYGDVTSSNACVGGIAGFTYANTRATEAEYKNSSAIYDSYNRGQVKATAKSVNTFAGGLVGRAEYLLMKNCYNTGAVSTADAAKTFLGTATGGFYQSIYNSVSLTYCSDDTNPGTGYTKNGGSITASGSASSLSYFNTEHKSIEAMAGSMFVNVLNRTSADAFVAIANEPPMLTWLGEKITCTVSFTGDYEGSAVTCAGGTVDLPECSEEGYRYVCAIPGNDDWDGSGVGGDLTVTVTKRKIDLAYVSFMAGGSQVDVNGDGTADRKDCIAFYVEDGKGTAYRYISRENIKSDSGGLTEIPDAAGVAAKTGYTVGWDLTDGNGESYFSSSRKTPLGTENILVRAVYRQNQLAMKKTDDGAGAIRFAAEISEGSTYYFLAPQTKGTITVKSGAKTVLDGANGPFTNVRIIVEKGAGLTLKNMVIRTDPVRIAGKDHSCAVLEIEGGSSAKSATILRYSGYNSIEGTNAGGNGTDADGDRIVCPAMQIKGYVKLKESSKNSDTLHITAAMDSPEINILNGATLDVTGGIVEVYKLQRLGTNGGMIYGVYFDYNKKKAAGSRKGNLTVSGGSLIAVSESNNVFAACVNNYRQTGGQATFIASEASQYRSGHKKYIGTDVALYAKKMTVTGGSLRSMVRTHRDKLSDKVKYYTDAKAIGSGNRFSKKWFVYKVDTSGWTAGDHTVKVDGKTVYKGGGNNVSYTYGSGDSFNTKKASADKYIYLWLKKGKAHTIRVDKKIIAKKVKK